MQRKYQGILLLVAFSFLISISMQHWIGKATIYNNKFEERSLKLHYAILNNKSPDGYTWFSFRASNSNNIRISIVMFAEFIHLITGSSINHIYFFIDTISIFFIIILLFAYLKKWFDDQSCILGVLYFCIVLPLTYLFHCCHPWDRPSLLVWIILIYLLREERMIAFSILLSLSVTIKFDTVLLPGLYFLYKIDRENWQRTIVVTGILLFLSFGTYYFLLLMFPAESSAGLGFDRIFWQIKTNLTHLYYRKFCYPPFLGFCIPIILAFYGFNLKNRFHKACVIFGLGLIIPWFLFSNLQEIRAEMMLLVLLLPSSILGLKKILV
jgi:hypothetical protein